MKLLILTQKVDSTDPVLGFFHKWIIEFSKHWEKVVVICLYEGKHNFPMNVKVISLGKEKGASKIKYVFNFYKYIYSERNNYDKVFVHMNQIYVLLGSIFWKLTGKDVYLWYVHKSVTNSLKLSIYFVKNIFTASVESFRVSTKKLLVVGHGIDTDNFMVEGDKVFDSKSIRLITVGRISRSKDLFTILKALKILKDKYSNISFDVIGGAVTTDDEIYFKELDGFIKSNNLVVNVRFLGTMQHDQIKNHLVKSDIFIHTSQTGSLDKAPLESILTNTVVISSSDALKPILEEYDLVFKQGDVEDLIEKIELYFNNPNTRKLEIVSDLCKYIVLNNSLTNLILKLSNEMQK